MQIYGLILNYLPFRVPVMIASKIKDQHFKSSIQFASGMFIFPIYYILLIALACLLTDGYLLPLLFGITLPVSGLFAFYNYQYLKQLWGRFRVFSLKNSKPELYHDLQQERNRILDLIKATINS